MWIEDGGRYRYYRPPIQSEERCDCGMYPQPGIDYDPETRQGTGKVGWRCVNERCGQFRPLQKVTVFHSA